LLKKCLEYYNLYIFGASEPGVKEPCLREPSVREPSVREPCVREPRPMAQGYNIALSQEPGDKIRNLKLWMEREWSRKDGASLERARLGL
jgi:hypothetical protein